MRSVPGVTRGLDKTPARRCKWNEQTWFGAFQVLLPSPESILGPESRIREEGKPAVSNCLDNELLGPIQCCTALLRAFSSVQFHSSPKSHSLRLQQLAGESTRKGSDSRLLASAAARGPLRAAPAGLRPAAKGIYLLALVPAASASAALPASSGCDSFSAFRLLEKKQPMVLARGVSLARYSSPARWLRHLLGVMWTPGAWAPQRSEYCPWNRPVARSPGFARQA